MSGQSKKSLNIAIFGCYISLAITVLMVGRENPVIALAQTDAASVFFVAVTFFALERQIMARCVIIHRVSLPIPSNSMTHCATMSMVAQAGQSSGWPVSDATGILTPVWAIASERENSSDSIFAKRRRMPSWLRPQQKNTQNPRSPNSATTAAVRFTVRRWWLSICIFSTWTAILKRCSYMFLLYCPTSTTILRL
ncbi:ash family protein [Salmonella enterica subsp. enterica serovar Newport]|nr:ash family protein [Salmonella enterica subsp. enterica serovar Newport]